MRKRSFLVVAIGFPDFSKTHPVQQFPRFLQPNTEFDRLLAKHGQETGLPVIVDFYSGKSAPWRSASSVAQRPTETIHSHR